MWVQVVRGGEAVGRAAGVFMANSSLVDDVLSDMWSQHRSLAEFPSLLYASTSSDPKNETAKLSPEDTVKDALNKKAGCAYGSPLYVLAPVRRPAAPAPLRPLRPLPLAVLLSTRPFCSAVPRTRSRRTHVSGSARAIPCPPSLALHPPFCHADASAMLPRPRRALLTDWPQWTRCELVPYTRCELVPPGCIPCRLLQSHLQSCSPALERCLASSGA